MGPWLAAWGMTAAATGAGPATCGAAEDRPLGVLKIPLGRDAEGGRLASLAPVDVDDDGRAELVGAVVPPFGHSVPMGLWSASVDPPTPPTLQSLAGLSFAGLRVLPGDVDGDGDLDVVLADPGNDEILRVTWLSDGIAVSPSFPADIGPEPIVADLGPDGVDELLSVSPIGGAAVWTLADRPAVLSRAPVPGVAQAVGDLDGDGAPEWLLAQGPRSRITVAWGGDLSAQEVFRVPLRDVRGVVAADLDWDGQAEILAVDRRRAGIRMFRGVGLAKGPWVVRLQAKGARDKPQTAQVADLDADGCPDVLLHSFATHELAIAWGVGRDRHHVQHLRTGAGPMVVGNLDGSPGHDVAVVVDDEVWVFSLRADAG